MNKECEYYDARYAKKVREESGSLDIYLSDKVDRLILLRSQMDDSKRPPKRR